MKESSRQQPELATKKLSREEKELIKTVAKFRIGLVQDSTVKHNCFSVCWPLEGFLNMVGNECKIEYGHVRVGEEFFEHCWIRCDNNNIIDPMADLYPTPNGKGLPPVYYGERPAWYHLSVTKNS